MGNQSGLINQGQNSIAIGNLAGVTNQSANSIILNASGAVQDAYNPGFFVSPVLPQATSTQTSVNLLGYGADGQIVQTGPSIRADGTFNSFSVNSASSVGIGTTATTSKFSVYNSANSQFNVFNGEINMVGSDTAGSSICSWITSNCAGTSTYATSTYGRLGRLTVNYNPSQGGSGSASYSRDWGIDTSGNLFFTHNQSTTQAFNIGNSGIFVQGTTMGTTTANNVGNFGLRISQLTSIQLSAGQIVGQMCFHGWGRSYASSFIRCMTDASNGYDDAGALVFGTSSGGTGAVETMRISTNGNVGIGTTTPGALVHLYGGSVGTQIIFQQAGANYWTMGHNSADGAFYLSSSYSSTANMFVRRDNTTTGWQVYSDYRLKENIVSLDGTDMLERIRKIRPVTFNMRCPNNNSKQIGVIAQDVQEIFPNIVSVSNSTVLDVENPLGISITGFMIPLLSAFQQLDNIVKVQNETIVSLESQLTAQTSQLTEVLSRLAALAPI